MSRTTLVALAMFLACCTSGCTVGPKYQRPQVALPDQFRGAAVPVATPSLADQKWFDLFPDATLKQLLTSALAHNFDMRIASERVLEARAQLGIVRGTEFPVVTGGAQFTETSNSTIGANRLAAAAAANRNVNYSTLLTSVSWDLDLWGRLRSLTAASRAQYLASEEGRHVVTLSLVGDVMTAYFSLLELDLELQIANSARDLAKDGLRLTNLRHDRGAVSGLDVAQSEQLLYTATAQIAGIERSIGLTQDALSLLAGEAPHDIPHVAKLEDLPLPLDLPAGLPSGLLTRRPDILGVEQSLIAANAQIGAARALFFPQITLTAFLGSQSRALSELLTGPSRELGVTPGALIPIFRSGLKAGLRLTEAQQREALLNYQKTIYGALRDVSDALVSHDRTHAQRLEQEKFVEALNTSARLANVRYRGGLDSYLPVLDAQRNQFQGQLALARLRRDEVLSVVQLYRALGGGWQ